METENSIRKLEYSRLLAKDSQFNKKYCRSKRLASTLDIDPYKKTLETLNTCHLMRRLADESRNLIELIQIASEAPKDYARALKTILDSTPVREDNWKRTIESLKVLTSEVEEPELPKLNGSLGITTSKSKTRSQTDEGVSPTSSFEPGR